MPEGGGDFELFSAPAASEKSEVSDEQFREQMKRQQKAIKDSQQEEGQAKAQDQSLAGIIVQFLSQPQNTDLFLLISRCVAQNVPSELILAVIALVDHRATEVVQRLLSSSQGASVSALVVHQPSDFQTMPPEQKKSVDQWVQNINHVATKHPQRILESVVINFKVSQYRPDVLREVSPVLVQLSAFILRNYLKHFQVEFEFKHLQDFMQAVFVEMVKNLETLVQGQHKLEESK